MDAEDLLALDLKPFEVWPSAALAHALPSCAPLHV
jgi:hypothetical protein